MARRRDRRRPPGEPAPVEPLELVEVVYLGEALEVGVGYRRYRLVSYAPTSGELIDTVLVLHDDDLAHH